MPKVFQTYEDAVSCRLCGATHAKPHDNQWKVCSNCFNAFFYSSGGILTEEAFTVFIASRLVTSIKRGTAGLQLGRCEVISNAVYGNAGYQCGHTAAVLMNGRKVCASHSKATVITYCGDKTIDEYEVFTNQLKYVSEHDERFAAAVRNSLDDAK